MTNRTKAFATIGAGLLMLALLVSIMAGPVVPATAAPAPAPTPASYDNSGEAVTPLIWANASAITADTRWCLELATHDVVDLQYVIDQTSGNVLTMTMQYSNDNSNYDAGAAVVTGNNADATDMQQFHLFGRYQCVYADVQDSDTVTVTVLGVAK